MIKLCKDHTFIWPMGVGGGPTFYPINPTASQNPYCGCQLEGGAVNFSAEMGAPDTENPLFLGFSVLRGGWRPWSQTMVSEGARPRGGGRSGDSQ